MKKAVYAGSFDPPTNGHLWMIQRGLEIFDTLIVAVGSNPSKSYTFSIPNRIQLLKNSVPSCERLVFDEFDRKYLVNYAESVGAEYILRGVRSAQDYEYERVMRAINGDMKPDIQTVFLMPPREIAEVSSSMVKGLIGPENWEDTVRRYVPEPVFKQLSENNTKS